MTEIPIPDPPDDADGVHRVGFLRRMQPVLMLVIAVSAIALAIWAGAENRRHNRLSVLPRLGAAIESGQINDTSFVRMAVESTGLGPVVVKDFRIYWDGVAEDSASTANRSSWQKVIDAVSAPGTEVNAHAYGAGYYFPTGRHEVLFEATRASTADSAGLGPLTDVLNRLAIQVCYCSVYDTDCDEVVLTAVEVKTLECSE